MKKLLSLILALAMTLSVATLASAEAQTTIKIASAMVTENPEGGLEQALADAYMALHPEVKIEFVSMPAPEVSKQIVVLAANDDLPDMFFVPNDFMSTLYELDIVADLEGLLGEEWLAGYNPNLLKDVKINGKMMSIPFYCSPYAVIYRTDWFQELGLTIPKTWDEFIEVSKALTRDTDQDGTVDKYAFSMVGARNNSGEQRFVLFTKSFGVDEVYQTEDGAWKSDIFEPGFKNGLQLFTDLYNVHGVVPPGPFEVDYSASMQLFTSGVTGMILSGPHSLGFITKTNPTWRNLGSLCDSHGYGSRRHFRHRRLHHHQHLRASGRLRGLYEVHHQR